MSLSDVNDQPEQAREDAPAPATEPEAAPAAPPVATLTVTFAPGTLEMGITSSGIISQSHLWAASALLDRIANQLWVDGQMAARQKAAQDRAAIQHVAAGLQVERQGRRT